MAYSTGEGVANAIAKNQDSPLGNEVWHPVGAPSQDQFYSTTPSERGMYITHKTFDPNGEHVGFQVHFLPKI